MPFSKLGKVSEKKWTETYDELFKSAIEDAGFGYTCKRSEIRNGSFTRDIIYNLKNARVVLADVSGTNPNVMWELGVRHTFSNRTILVVRKDMLGERIISDLKTHGVIEYNTRNITEINKFKRKIQSLLEGIEDDPEHIDSPIFEALTEEEVILSSSERNKNISNLKGLLSELLYDLDFAEDVKQGETNVNLESTTLGKYKTSAMNYLLSTNYVSADESFYSSIRSIASLAETINKRLDLVMLDKRLKLDYGHPEAIKEKSEGLIDKIKPVIKKTNDLVKSIRKGLLEYVEPPVLIIKKEHQDLLD